MTILTYLVVGLFVGLVARFLVSGTHRLGCFGTSGLGILGSIVGGVVLNILGGNGFALGPTGFLGSVFGAVLVLAAAKKLSPGNSR